VVCLKQLLLLPHPVSDWLINFMLLINCVNFFIDSKQQCKEKFDEEEKSGPPPPSAPRLQQKEERVAQVNTNMLVLQLGTLGEESTMGTLNYYCKNSNCCQLHQS